MTVIDYVNDDILPFIGDTNYPLEDQFENLELFANDMLAAGMEFFGCACQNYGAFCGIQ